MLSELTVGDPDRIARFEQEARATATLNHPNIVALYDVGNDGGTAYVVSELLVGSTLRERIDAGPFPLRKALDLASGILSGLAAAHERGIAHRDLKPENIFVTTAGPVKILDFGLAKLTHAVAPGAAQTGVTITAPQTTPGLVMGTVGYMAPEQVRGLSADHRADIFAFGAILYEMLTGRRAFHGATTADTMTAILTADPPDLSSGGGAIPAATNVVIRRCLEKDPHDRFQSARDLAFALEAIALQTGNGPSSTAVSPPRRRMRTAIAAAAVTGVVLLAGASAWRLARPVPAAAVRLAVSISAPPEMEIEHTPAVSPDGRSIAYVASDNRAVSRILIRSLDTFDIRAVGGTEGGDAPFWSPDGRALAFFARGRLWRVDLAGGQPRLLASVTDARGGTWGNGNVIVYSPHPDGALFRISADGGTPAALTTLDRAKQEISHRWPRFLPDGRHVLFLNRIASTPLPGYTISAAPIGGGSVTRLLDSASTGVYDSGRLLFMRAEKLFAQPFDPATLALSGDPEIVGDRIWNDGVATAGLVGFDAAAGVLALRPAVSDRTRIAWRDVSGKTLGELAGDGAVEAVPTRDGRLVILVRPDGQLNSLGYTILDAARGTTVPFTAPDATSTSPVWSPDNRRIVYSSVRDGAFDLFIREVKPGGADTRLLHTDGMKAAQSWSPDGEILFTAIDAQTRLDIWAIDAIPGAKPKLFAGGAGDQCCGRFSPDGKWVAYTASETGRPEVFVKSFTGDGDAVQVSVNGGGAAEWSGNGSEIFYLTPDNRLISVPVTLSGDRAIVGQPTPHFLIHSRIRPAVRMLVTDNRIFAAAGDRLLVTETIGDSSSSTINLLLNWTAPPGAGR